jgi:PAS domain S-box-containing protein
MILKTARIRLLMSQALLWLLIAGFAAYEIERSRREYLREAETTTVFQARAFAENTRSTIKRLNELLLNLRTEWHGDWERFAAVVKARQEHIQDITFQIGVIDAEGLLAYSNLAPPKDRVDLSDREHFRVHRDSGEDRLFISKPIKGRVTGKWTIQFTRPIFVGGTFKGVIVASISPDNFIAFHDTLKLGELGASSILRGNSEVMAHAPNGDEYLGRVIAWPLQDAASPVSGTFTFASQLDGIERVFGYRKLPEYGLTCVVAEATKELLAPHQQHARNVIGYALGIAALLSIFILMLHRTAVAREQALAKLRESEEQLRLLGTGMAQTTASLVVTDTTGAIVFVNDAFVRVSGYAREEVLGQNPRLLKSGLNPPDLYQDLWGTITSGKTWRGELQNRRKDGTIYWELAIISPVTEKNGAISHFIAVKEDITERKRTEDELAQHRHHLEELVEKRTADLGEAKIVAEAANRAKSAFLANMSHELRTPMHGVLGMIDMAKLSMADAKGLDQLDKAKRSAERLLGVLNDILDLSKIEADRMVLEDMPLRLDQTVAHIVGVLEHNATKKGLKLAVDMPSDLASLPLKGDPLRLGQVLFNLVGNAIKFTEQGAVILSVRQISESSEVAQVRFEVADTGIGIDAEAQTRLFNSFEQADNTMTRKYGGTGLGLAISKKLVQMMGGEIGIESAVGHGSTFWFAVPFKKREDSADTPAPTVSSLTAEQRLLQDFDGARILLAEDEPISQEVTRGLLENVGLLVDLAEDGGQALELAKRNHYALILMDMQMPVMNGVESTRAIRTDSLNQTTPILAMTASAFAEDREVCVAAGMNEHISKPVDLEKLYETLLVWLERHDNGSAA